MIISPLSRRLASSLVAPVASSACLRVDIQIASTMDDLDACLFEMDAAVRMPDNGTEIGDNADAGLLDDCKPSEDSGTLCGINSSSSSSSNADHEQTTDLWDPSAKPPPLPRAMLSVASTVKTAPFPQVLETISWG